MQSVTTDSIDIESLRRRMLGDTQPSYRGLRSAHNAFQHALTQPALRRTSDQVSVMLENDSGLPSTVPESLDAHAQRLQPQTSLPNANATKKMSQVDDATQELSQDFLDQRLEQSRSRLVAARNNESQRSLVEGDTYFVDLASSWPNEDAKGESQPLDVDILPTQDHTQQHEKFADSQRFKTPATAAKKRSYNGNTKETPVLPRAPLLRSRGTPGMAMGLSQAFADTQAQTSPFVTGTMNPTSDRPSPNIELEQRPATAPESSPLRPIGAIRNSSAEPAIRYVSVAESQERRREELDRELAEEATDSDSSFDQPNTQARNWNRKQARRKLVDLKEPVGRSQASRPRKRRREDPLRSPAAGEIPAAEASPGRQSHLRRRRRTTPIPIEDSRTDSEAETEQEDEGALVMHSSQRQVDPEGKENIDIAIQIPQTVARASRTIELRANVPASPSSRPNPPTSSAGPLVPNTQISHGGSQRGNMKSSTTSGLDFVPQSQDVTDGEQASTVEGRGGRSGAEPVVEADQDNLRQSVEADADNDEDIEMQDDPQEEDDEEEVETKTAVDQPETVRSRPSPSVRMRDSHQHTVSETASTRSTTKQVSNTGTEGSNIEGTVFDTAPSHMLPPNVRPQPASSPPLSTPRRKHARASQVSTEGSAKGNSWSQIFNAREALEDQDGMNAFDDQSPISTRRRRRMPQHPTYEVAETESTEKAQIPLTGSEKELDNTDELLESQPAVRPLQRSLRSKAPSRGRDSVFDLGVTPSPQKGAPVLKSSTRQSRGRVDKIEDRPSTLVMPDVAAREDDISEASSAEHQPTQTQTPKKTPKKKQQVRQVSIDSTTDSLATFQTAPAGDILVPNAVFACFNGKTRAYYPAWCIGKGSTEGHYTIKWEDYDPDEIDVYGVRSLDLRVGDQVKVDMKGVPKVSHIIHGFKDKLEGDALDKTITDQRGFKTVLVVPKQRKSLPAEMTTENEREVPVSAIYLDSNMWAHMKDRTYTYCAPLQSVHASGYASPAITSPSGSQSRQRRQTAVQTPIVQPNGLLNGMVFAVSYEDGSRRRELDSLIWSNGGHIVGDDGFADLFELDTMTLKAKYADANFTALLADKHSRKPKYLQALALGLPCLSGAWVDACIEKGELLEWRHYLLPAGECDKLEGAAKSRFIPYLAAGEATLAVQLETREHILNGEKVAIIVGRGKAEAKMKNFLFFIRAMGVQSLEKVADVRAAKELIDGDSGYGMVFVDKDVEAVEAALRVGRPVKKAVGKSKAKAKAGAAFVVSDTETIVQSLIFGSRVA